MNQAAKAELFRSLHERPGAFVIPNPWDAGTAILLAGLGFEALATTSGGLAFSLGRRDAGGLTRDETIANVRAIASATSLPVSADLENGYADAPEAAAQALLLAAEAGAVGGSLEDATGDSSSPIYDFDPFRGEGGGSRGSRQKAAFSLHVHGARRKLPLRQGRSGRYHPPPAGL